MRQLTKDLSIAATTTVYLSLADSGDLKWAIKNVRILSDASIATHAANYYTAALVGSDGTSGIGSWTGNSSGGTALTAGVPAGIAVAGSLGTAGELNMSSGQSLKLVMTKTGSAADFTGQLLVELEPVA